MPLLCLTMSVRAKLRCRCRLGYFLSKPFICFATLSDIVHKKNDKIYNNDVSRESPLPHWLWQPMNGYIRPNDGHAQINKNQASHALACGTTVSRRIWHLPVAANHSRGLYAEFISITTHLAKGFKQNSPNWTSFRLLLWQHWWSTVLA